VPVLCWHQLRDWRPGDSGTARTELICPPRHFRAQLDALKHDGWTTIGPDQYVTHLTTGARLPPKPVILTFDDSQASQITEGLPDLVARAMTATFFVMTVVLGKQGWMTNRDVKHLADEGMTVAAHTWDHHRVDRYSGSDWKIQLDQPKALLEKLTGKPVEHFAYPYGLWNRAAFPHLAAAGYRTAFQLRQFPIDPTQPLYSLRRIIVVSTWTGPELLTALTDRR
jgi:peptidoglycan/xylan/chitin deacetylase (PgdA/CDA1 family)